MRALVEDRRPGQAGLRAFKTERFELDVGFSGAFGSSTDEVEARRGMWGRGRNAIPRHYRGEDARRAEAGGDRSGDRHRQSDRADRDGVGRLGERVGFAGRELERQRNRQH